MLVGQPNAEELAEDIVARGLNVRQVETLARQSGKEQAKDLKPKRRTGKDADTVALEKRVSDALGLQVSVDHRGGRACCTSTTAISSSSTRCCGGWSGRSRQTREISGVMRQLERISFPWKRKPLQHLMLSHFRTGNRIPLFLKCSSRPLKNSFSP